MITVDTIAKMIPEQHGSYPTRQTIAQGILEHIISEDDGLIMGTLIDTIDAHYVYRIIRVGGASAKFVAEPGAHAAIARRFKDNRP